ncbi:MAG: aminotransferase class V-fold PLP-dependent enzyme [Phycisphaerae bacterium]
MRTSRRDFVQRATAFAAAGAFGLIALREDAIQRVAAAGQKHAATPPEQLAGDEDFWFQIQQAFAIDRSVINLNNGGISPSPRVVQDAFRRHLEFANQLPARNLWHVQDPQVEHVRTGLARLFGCAVDEMAITRNASESLETCLLGFDLKAGDEVLTTDLDYPRMISTIRQRELREGIKLVQIKIEPPVNDVQEIVAAYAAAITPRTKLILASHVVFITGQIQPIADIVKLGRERGIPVIVDGAHAFAHVPFKRDDIDCDYYGVSLHKWLTAPHGTGFLYVRKERIAGLWPLMAAEKPQSDNIRKFEEIGTHPAATRLAIAEAITLFETIGAQRKYARLCHLRRRWSERIASDKRVHFYTKLDPASAGGFVTFSIDGVDMRKLHEHLWAQHKMFTVCVEHAKVLSLRISPNVYTTIGEVDQFAEAIESVIASGLPTV